MDETLLEPTQYQKENLTLSLYTQGIDLFTFADFFTEIIDAIILLSDINTQDIESSIQHLTPHLSHLIDIISANETLDSNIEKLIATIYQLPINIVLLDDNVILSASKIAHSFITNNPITPFNDNLVCSESPLWTTINNHPHTATTLTIAKHQYFYIPLSTATQANNHYSCLFIESDKNDNNQAWSVDTLKALFSLTKRESEILSVWSQSNDIVTTAKLLNLKENSLRQNLKKIREKLGSNSQKDMLTQLLRTYPIANATTTLSTQNNPADKILTLYDKRQLSYRDIGPATGHPVIYMHSLAGSRKEQLVSEDYLTRNNIRLIIPERPGYGLTSPNPYISLTSTITESVQLIEHLAIDTFSIIGHCTGSRYATHLAAHFKSRVKQLTLVSFIPPGKLSLSVSQKFPDLFSIGQWTYKRSPLFVNKILTILYRGDPKKQLQRYINSSHSMHALPPMDVNLFSRKKFFEYYTDSLIEGLKYGPQTYVQELEFLLQDKGNHLSDITAPTYIWHGEQDSIVDQQRLVGFADLLPLRKIHRIIDETHFLFFRNAEKIFDSIMTTPVQFEPA
ncbi:hypothetical protein A9Q99_21890 [Gammaproteobacteria bacterium 45_16_T64]|nr:hypothetical protein A9Q99_21890 [Gammaproteobacteria bacterium 45_16_T64]